MVKCQRLSGILVTYTYLRYKWGEGHDMDQLQARLSERFSVRRRDFPGNDIEVSLFKDDRIELIVTAERMRAHINAHRAILNQIQEGPFTKYSTHNIKMSEALRKRLL